MVNGIWKQVAVKAPEGVQYNPVGGAIQPGREDYTTPEGVQYNPRGGTIQPQRGCNTTPEGLNMHRKGMLPIFLSPHGDKGSRFVIRGNSLKQD
jgi:hypothetical protein